MMKTMRWKLIACALCFVLLPATMASAEGLNTGDYLRFGTDYVWQVVNVEDDLATLLLDGYMTGVFDVSRHMEAHMVGSRDYRNYGSVSWEYSDLRQWLNSREQSPVYRDVAFDYSDLKQGMNRWSVSGIIPVSDPAENPYSGMPGFLNGGAFSEQEYCLIEPRTSTHIIPPTQSNAPAVRAGDFRNFTADMTHVYGELIQHTVERSATVDRMFLLSGREVQAYLLHNGIAPNRLSDGQTCPPYWLRDSVMWGLGYYTYYGLHQLVADNGRATEKGAEYSAAIRPACVINLAYVTGTTGSGTAENPYALQISPTVVRRALPALGSPATDVTVLDSSVTRSTFTDEQHSMRANGKTVASSVLVTSQPIRNCTGLTLELRVTDLVRGNVEGDWAFLYRDLKGDWNVGGVFALDGDSASARLEFPEPVSFDAWTVPCLCLGDEWQFNYSVWLDDVCVIN